MVSIFALCAWLVMKRSLGSGKGLWVRGSRGVGGMKIDSVRTYVNVDVAINVEDHAWLRVLHIALRTTKPHVRTPIAIPPSRGSPPSQRRRNAALSPANLGLRYPESNLPTSPRAVATVPAPGDGSLDDET